MFTKLFAKKPSAYSAHIATANLDLQVGAKETILQAALNQGIAFPHSCRAGGCGECKCRLAKGKVKELTDKSYLLSAEEIRDNYILACQSIPQTDIELDVMLRESATTTTVQKSTGRIERMTALTQDIVHLVIALDQAMAFTPGQYAEIAMPQSITTGIASDTARSYSFANVPSASGTSSVAEFFIRKVPGGRFTTWLFDAAKLGDRLELTGPYGDFMLRQSDAPIVCIAGGSGLAPVLSLLQGALQTLKQARNVTLVFGARTQNDLYMLDAIEALRQEWPVRFEFVPVLANEPADSTWMGRRGLIPTQLPEILGTTMHQHHAYLCGPPGMIDACVATLKAGEVSDTAICFDKFLDKSHVGVMKQAA